MPRAIGFWAVLLLIDHSVDLGFINALLEILGATYFVVALLKWKDRPATKMHPKP